MDVVSKLFALVFLFAAIFAEAVNLESVAGGFEVVLASNLLFQAIHLGRKELHRAAAVSANHVVMPAAVVLVFEACNSVMKSHFTGQATLSQELQRAVHRGETDFGIFLLHQPVQFVGGKVLARLQEGLQDRVALGGVLKAYAFEVLMQNLLGLAHHLAGNGGLIVNAALKHDHIE
jgi:hypothetical protein